MCDGSFFCKGDTLKMNSCQNIPTYEKYFTMFQEQANIWPLLDFNKNFKRKGKRKESRLKMFEHKRKCQKIFSKISLVCFLFVSKSILTIYLNHKMENMSSVEGIKWVKIGPTHDF